MTEPGPHDIWRPVYKSNKSGLDRIPSELRTEMASLRSAVTALQTAARRKPAPITAEAAERESAKQKRIEERAAARRDHAEFLAKQAAAQPANDKARAEWEAKEKARVRELGRIRDQRYRKANPEKVRESRQRCNEKQRAERAKRLAEQIGARPDLLPGGSL